MNAMSVIAVAGLDAASTLFCVRASLS